jgi:DNA-binding response OmpR family regulator
MSRILIVEDDSSTRSSLDALLRGAGHEVFTVAHVVAAMNLISQVAFDIAIIDLTLTDGYGLDIVRRVGQRMPPFVVLTGFATVGAVIDAFRSHALDVFEKPLDPDALLMAIEAAYHRPSRSAFCCPPTAHAANRLARAIVSLANATSDPSSTDKWARSIAVSRGALRSWCHAAGFRPKSCLLFGRLLRATHILEHSPLRLREILDVVDRRTFDHMLYTAGFDSSHFPTTINEFIITQRLLPSGDLLAEVQGILRRQISWRDVNTLGGKTDVA